MVRSILVMVISMLVNFRRDSFMVMGYCCVPLKWNGSMANLLMANWMMLLILIIKDILKISFRFGIRVWGGFIRDIERDGLIWIFSFQISFIFIKFWRRHLSSRSLKLTLISRKLSRKMNRDYRGFKINFNKDIQAILKLLMWTESYKSTIQFVQANSHIFPLHLQKEVDTIDKKLKI